MLSLYVFDGKRQGKVLFFQVAVAYNIGRKQINPGSSTPDGSLSALMCACIKVLSKGVPLKRDLQAMITYKNVWHFTQRRKSLEMA